jgi:hypothetical protein
LLDVVVAISDPQGNGNLCERDTQDAQRNDEQLEIGSSKRLIFGFP